DIFLAPPIRSAHLRGRALRSGGLSLNSSSRVLIVDESAESREVLCALLACHGASTIEARRPDEAAQLTDEHRPHLILFDADSDHSNSAVATQSLKDAADRIGSPIVILGTVQNARKPHSSDQFFAKPYHYGPLIRKIEDLLAAG